MKTKPRGTLRWKLMYLLIVPLSLFMSMDRTNMTVAAPIIQKEFHFSLVEMSLILTSFTWIYAIFQIPGGLFTERKGPRKALAYADIWWSFWTIMTAAGSSVFTFVGIRSLLGLGQAADYSATIGSINRWFPKHERTRAVSSNMIGLYLGAVIGTPLTVAIVEGLGWRWAFYIFGVVGAVLGILWYVFYRDRPQEHPMISKEELEYIEADPDTTAAKTKSDREDWKRFLSSAQFWAFGLQYFFLILVQGFYNTWLPTYLIKARGFSMTSMGFAASLPWVAELVMVIAMGFIQDRVLAKSGSKWRARVPFAVAGFVLAAVFLIIGSQVTSTWIMLICFMISLGSLAMVQITISATCTDLGGNLSPSVAGWTNFWGNLSGALGPIIMALIVSATSSWASALLVMGLSSLVGAVLWFFVRPQQALYTEQKLDESIQNTVSSV
jgi:ACS family glucarate transporter-like MFS transporter